ncbi:MAG TPA: cyclic nucleotide-binding domain-containing protein [Candidatus Ozemobacteraceae bacterium]|nr:cyclic nucleotide-binding domain-containing protein [Candidatus Ozemobacteraceae bacterium]
MTPISLLKSIALFEGLEESDLNKISQVVKERTAPKGTVLFKEGDIGDSFYLIKSGGVEILKKENGEEKVVNTIEAGDKNNFFGEMALIEGVSRSATLRASKDSELLVISKTDFDMLLRLNSFIALRIMTALSKRLRATGPEKPVDEKLAKIITLFSPKSGAGKSVLAANLAAGLTKAGGEKVLIIDLELQFGDMAFMLGLNPRRTIADLVEHQADKPDVLNEYLVRHPLGFSVLAAPFKPEQSEMITSSHLRTILDSVRKHFDWIILDLHSFFQDLTINSMDLADYILLVLLPNMNHIKNMHVCLKVMENLKYPPEKIKLLMNREGSPNARSREEITNALKHKVDFGIHDDANAVCQLFDKQKTVFEFDGESPYRADLLKLMESITGKTYKSENAGGGLLGKLKGFFGS